LKTDFRHDTLNDSKMLSEKQRLALRPLLEDAAVTFAVAHVFPGTIDEINILNASIKAMHLALNELTQPPEFILVDGNKFSPYKKIPHSCIVKGDQKFMHIAAASVLAKTARDAYMEKIHEEYPMYNWKQNKGYPTAEHREAIIQYGPTPYHRKSFRLLPEQLRLDF
ncbi:MAG: ribonuclease HII, partial [Eudoraea sp.]|nr:ribonuclease HII [Eudoraea sp.]NNJ40336.1 ribonuclease HII [Eudoraea sp.]